MLKGLQLMVLSFHSKKQNNTTISRIIVFALGMGIGGLASGTFGVALRYVIKKSDDFVSAVQDIFILLFVLDCDEKALDIIKYWNPNYVNQLFDTEENDEQGEHQ